MKLSMSMLLPALAFAPAASASQGVLTTTSLEQGLTPMDLVVALVGPNVAVDNVVYHGAGSAAGTFQGGTGIIGFEAGVVLSTGAIASVAGPQNTADYTSTDHGLPGDSDLQQYTPGVSTFDASVLEFDFICDEAHLAAIQFVFSSDEYNESVGTVIDDLCACFVNGVNVALVPGTTEHVGIRTVHCGEPYDPPNGSHCDLFVNNDCEDLGGSFPCTHVEMEMDGLTTVFTASPNVIAGVNHVKLAIVDSYDATVDSNFFIRGEGFDCVATGGFPVFQAPSPCGETLVGDVGAPIELDVVALATTGLPGEQVTLTVTGSSAPLGHGSFVPPLPSSGQPAATHFAWTPTSADVGPHSLTFTATDQLGRTSSCTVALVVDAFVEYCFGSGCPCGNDDASAGCANSSGTGGLLTAAGSSSIAADDLRFAASNLVPSQSVLLFCADMALNGGHGIVFGDGLRCAGGHAVRLGTVTVDGAGAATWGPGLNARGGWAPGFVRRFQGWYRDPAGPCTSGFDLTNGIEVSFVQ